METQIEKICPHLGSENDPLTTFSYPSQRNICYHAKGTTTPRLDHQRSTCLTAKYVNCPVYTNIAMEKMPKNILLKSRRIITKPKNIALIFIIIVLISIVLLAFLFLWP